MVTAEENMLSLSLFKTSPQALYLPLLLSPYCCCLPAPKNRYIFFIITEHSFQTQANSVSQSWFFSPCCLFFSGCIKVTEVLWRLSVPRRVPCQHWDCVSGDFSILFFCCRCVVQARVELLEEGAVSCHSVSTPLSCDHRALDSGPSVDGKLNPLL